MDVDKEKNGNIEDSKPDGSTEADDSASAAATNSDTNSTSPAGPSTNDVRRKRRGSNEIFSWKLLKKDGTNSAAGGLESNASFNSTTDTQPSDLKMEDSSPGNEENSIRVKEMVDDSNETVVPSSDQVSFNNEPEIRYLNNALLLIFTAFEGRSFVIKQLEFFQ